jgi:hypothetical protein
MFERAPADGASGLSERLGRVMSLNALPVARPPETL